ncbi:N-acetylneuraminate synthase [Thermodesulfobacteriota bacterium]
MNLEIAANNDRVFIIAEAGINHNGSLELAKKMISAAVEAGADAIKFQTFTAEKIISRLAPKAEYQKKHTDHEESQLEMVKKLELSERDHRELLDDCIRRKITFLSSPFDIESADFLITLGLEMLKIPSGEITNLPYIRHIGELGKKIIMSSGMSDLGEIEDALDILVSAGTKRKNITILHCNTEYPTPFEDVNLRAMLTIKAAFPGIQVGYSDHTLGVEIPIAAVAMGASVIEKHFTLDRNLPGPDHKASLIPEELHAMIQGIRNIEKALGNGVKKPSKSELKNRDIARKSIVAAKSIRIGEIFSEENLTVKRPGGGISPMRWDELIGKKAEKAFEPDELI